ncbi:hypothetical protein LCGC14_1381720 [marine sediment metagenome]|uniref:Uncharacterized protein n=1 Tax=marine sediment metagenome TaxID=412755 RepID=A0A0F9N463_9ZZZZ
MVDDNYSKLQYMIIDFLYDLHGKHDIINISNSYVANIIGEQIYNILKPKVKE